MHDAGHRDAPDFLIHRNTNAPVAMTGAFCCARYGLRTM